METATREAGADQAGATASSAEMTEPLDGSLPQSPELQGHDTKQIIAKYTGELVIGPEPSERPVVVNYAGSTSGEEDDNQETTKGGW